MDLKTFVTESLSQIAAGIKAAQEAETGAWFAPKVSWSEKGKEEINTGVIAGAPQKILFDIAVTASDEDKASGGGGIQVLWAKMGANMETSSANSTITRISFEIPVAWPRGERPKGW